MTEPDIARAAERVVSDHFDADVRLELAYLVPDRRISVVARLRTVTAPSHVPPTVIVKAAHPTFPGAADEIRNEWAALALLTELAGTGEPLCPRLYGGDASTPMVVMEDLGSGDGSPAHVVEGDDPDAATASLLAYIEAIARLHVTTRGHRDTFQRLRSAIGPVRPPKPLFHDPWSEAVARTDEEVVTAIGEYHAVLTSLGVRALSGVDDEIAEATWRVEHDPGPWLALCQGDQNGQGNSLLRDGRLRLHDFGSGGFRHALIEGVPHRITWGCIRRVPDNVATAMDSAYQAAIPREATPSFVDAATYALTRWHVFHVIWRVPDALRRDRPRGPATLRQQTIAWIAAYVEWSDRHGVAMALAGTARRIVQRLRELWPPYTHTIEYLPAYRGVTRVTAHDEPSRRRL